MLALALLGTGPALGVSADDATPPTFTVTPVAGPAKGWPTRQQRTEAISGRAVTAATAAVAAPREGSFIQFDRKIFRVVGGAPLYVNTWAPFGGPQPYTVVSSSQFGQLYLWPLNGTFIRSGQTRQVFRFVNGAPVYVSTWAAFGGNAQPATTIDQADLDQAGRDYPWDGVAAYTQDNDDSPGPVFVKGGQTGRIYKMTGGAPVYVSTWAAYDNTPQPTLTVDQSALDRAGQAGAYRFVRRYPSDGWTVVAGQTGQVFIIAGGAPIYVTTSTVLTQFPSTIDNNTILRGGTAAPYDHLLFTPADGTFIRGNPSHRIYRVAAGVPTYVPSWAPYGGPQPYVDEDQVAIDRGGSASPFDHLQAPQ